MHSRLYNPIRQFNSSVMPDTTTSPAPSASLDTTNTPAHSQQSTPNDLSALISTLFSISILTTVRQSTSPKSRLTSQSWQISAMAPSKNNSQSTSSNRHGEVVGSQANVLASCYIVDLTLGLTGFHYSTTGAGGTYIPLPPSSPSAK